MKTKTGNFFQTQMDPMFYVKKSFHTLHDHEMVELKFLLEEVKSLKRHRAWATHSLANIGLA